MMDLHSFCAIVGMPVMGLTSIGVGLAGMGVNLLDLLHLGGLRQILQPLVGLVGLVCIVDWVMCNFHMAG
jgi:hypothetical protein